MERSFTVEEARDLLPEVQRRVDELAELRRAVVEAREGPVADRKAAEARLSEAVEWFVTNGVQLKSIAPVVLDFPSEIEGEPALLCWLEGEDDLEWYHTPEHGFMGRKPLHL